MRGCVTFAGSVRAGDMVRHNDEYTTVVKVRRAQGRKPAEGENLHIVVTGGDVVKINSLQPVRLVRAPA